MSNALRDFSDALAALVQRGGQSVVRVEARRWRGASGTVYTDDGVVVTASHAVERDESITVGLPDGTTTSATLVGRDHGTDVAVLRVADAKGLVAANWGELGGARVGHYTIALGRPGRTVRASSGILGALGDEFRTPAGGTLERYVQTDGGLPWGFAGGPLLDADGAVLGVNSPALVRGANLVVPTATVRRVVAELLAHGQVRKGYLGVGVYPVRLPDALAAQISQPSGVALVAIEPGGPAEKSGLLMGDVVVTLDGQPVRGPRELAAALDGRIDKQVVARIVRAGALTDVTVTVGTRPA